MVSLLLPSDSLLLLSSLTPACLHSIMWHCLMMHLLLNPPSPPLPCFPWHTAQAAKNAPACQLSLHCLLVRSLLLLLSASLSSAPACQLVLS